MNPIYSEELKQHLTSALAAFVRQTGISLKDLKAVCAEVDAIEKQRRWEQEMKDRNEQIRFEMEIVREKYAEIAKARSLQGEEQSRFYAQMEGGQA